jgi:hypothetical protein
LLSLLGRPILNYTLFHFYNDYVNYIDFELSDFTIYEKWADEIIYSNYVVKDINAYEKWFFGNRKKKIICHLIWI